MFKKDDFLFGLDFDLYPDEDVSLEAIKLFQEKVEGYHWALSQSGEIVRAHFKDLPNMSFIVNTRDEQT